MKSKRPLRKQTFNPRPAGVHGMKQSGGFVYEEFLNELRFKYGQKAYREMADNDATIGTALSSIEMLFRGADWRFKSKNSKVITPKQQEAIDWCSSVFFEDMCEPWDEFISDVLTMFVYGWSLFAKSFKIRDGKGSKYTDGTIGIDRLAIREQETLHNWDIDPFTGDVLGFIQVPEYEPGGMYYIPRKKFLLFKSRSNRGNPEGASILRNAFRPYFFLKRIQEIESIAIERELNGMPVVYIPSELLGSDDPDDMSIVSAYEKLVRDARYNSQGGMVLPSDTYQDADGRPSTVAKVRFELVSSNGTRAIDTNQSITRYQLDIARSMLADFVMLGTNDRGSFALSESKINLFLKSIQGWGEVITTAINRDMLVDLWELNGFDQDVMPRLCLDNVIDVDLQKFADYVDKMSRAGMPLFPDENLEEYIREKAKLPVGSGTATIEDVDVVTDKVPEDTEE